MSKRLAVMISFSGDGGVERMVTNLCAEFVHHVQVDLLALKLDGGLRVADAASAPRFNPLISDDFNLSLVDGKIVARGVLREPAGRTPVTSVDIAHDLSAGTGRAILDVPELRFGKTLQPDALTHLALGVVANVDALVSGRGEIRWTPDGVTSGSVVAITSFAKCGRQTAGSASPCVAATGSQPRIRIVVCSRWRSPRDRVRRASR